MNISIPIKAVRNASADERKFLRGAYKEGYTFDRIVDGHKDYPDNHRIQFSITDLSQDNITKLWSFCNRNDIDTLTLNKIQRWSDAMKNPMDAPVPSVTALKEMLLKLMATIPYKWLMMESDDGYLMPHLVTGITYQPTTKYGPEHVDLSLSHGYFYNSSEYTDEEKGKVSSNRISFYSEDLMSGIKAEKMNSFARDLYDLADESLNIGVSDDDDDNNDDDNTGKTKTKSKPKKPAVTKQKRTSLKLLEILANENLFVPTDDNLAAFFEWSRQCQVISTQMGKQFTCTTKAFVKTGKWDTRSLQNMHEDGVPYRLVVDMRGIASGLDRQKETGKWGQQLLPYHPYVRMYNLTKYSYCDVHTASLAPYEYNKGILANMIIPQTLKDYLGAIIGGRNVFNDIISGKSGGMIILASGRPGLGKTLTAETYSEQMELPLYQIQSSQLGIEVDNIEANLASALRKAERWNAVLLIDECDTYIRKREKDIVQNCIVGVWLRLLEYFQGIMFLTTNQHDVIDEAILSRCTAHIRFEMPDEDSRRKILLVHSKVQHIDLSEQEAGAIAKKYEMSGRDIRNMMKNINKFYHNENGKRIKLTAKMIEPIKDYIPFIK